MKIWGYVALATILVAAVAKGVHWTYQRGYADATSKQQELVLQQVNIAIERARDEWELTREAAEVQLVVEERIVEVIREVEREVPIVVERLVEIKPECRDLGTEYAGLLNAAVHASNTAEM